MKNINEKLRTEILVPDICRVFDKLAYYDVFKKFDTEPMPIIWAHAFGTQLLNSEKHVYDNDLIVGSVRHTIIPVTMCDKDEEKEAYMDNIGFRSYVNKESHATPSYEKLLEKGIDGIISETHAAYEKLNTDDIDYFHKMNFLDAVLISLDYFRKYIIEYADSVARKNVLGNKRFHHIEEDLRYIAYNTPKTFRQALQLIIMLHTSFKLENRYAMALGRVDQYLYEYYINDIKNNIISQDEAIILMGNAFLRFCEFKTPDFVNICIAGQKPDGSCGENELSIAIIKAVKHINVPGPNLSVSAHNDLSDNFYMECIESLKTGLGYPAILNGHVLTDALLNKGVSLLDARNHSYVGCIENFITGKQPPWSDSRFDTPVFLELALNNGRNFLDNKFIGIDTGDCQDFKTYEDFFNAFKLQFEFAAKNHVAILNNANAKFNPNYYVSPLLSAFFKDCIGRARDINNNGCIYKSSHGVVIMGIATVVDSLLAIKKHVFDEKNISIIELKNMLKLNFKGYEYQRLLLKNRTAKYGNDIDEVDDIAVWFVQYCADIFNRYKAHDGGWFYTAMASNVQNISAGKLVGASADGRLAKEPLSDAASPTYGADKNGPSATLRSVSKPDYTQVACGSVINQKYPHSFFDSRENCHKVIALIRNYIKMGGQEIQINVTGHETLIDAKNNPEKYNDLVVRVSGFSAFYNSLDDDTKNDIIARTMQGL